MFDQMREEVHEAWRFLREHNSAVPDNIIDLMRDAALREIDEAEAIRAIDKANREWAHDEERAARSSESENDNGR